MDEVAKEIKVRSRLMNIYNKSEDEFKTKEEWDDYLEMIEDIVYSLVNNVDVQKAEASISEYERENKVNILANQARKLEAERRARAGPVALLIENSFKTAPDAYMPSALASAPQGRQPVPVNAAAVNDGRIVYAKKAMAMGCAEEQRISAAAGWSPDMPAVRAMHEAFGSLLLHW